MQEKELGDIQKKATNYNSTDKKWHFHIMSPNCVFNKSDRFAFILEGPDQTYVHYSDRAEKELGQDLSPLLHGDTVLNPISVSTEYVPTPTVNHIIKRAKQLNANGIAWHHHMLFPDCTLNLNSPKYALVFEDPETGNNITSLTDKEPTNDLKQIESLFYK